MRIWVKPDQLAKLGVTIPQIVQALQTQNNVNPAGQWVASRRARPAVHLLDARAGASDYAEEFGEIILRSNSDGSNLRLKDVARMEMGAQTYGLTGVQRQPRGVLACYQLPGSNAVDAGQSLRAKVDELSKRFPQDLTTQSWTPRPVTAGMKEFHHAAGSACVGVLVVYIFLQAGARR